MTLIVFSILLAGLLDFSQPAMAYLDPGTGSLVVQGLIAGTLGVLFFFRSQILRIKSFAQSLIKGKRPHSK